jgi:hypothetical protein
MNNHPWNIWWDFVWSGADIRWIAIRTSHPDYKHIDYIYMIPIELCEDKNGYVDEWIEKWFVPFNDKLVNGRESIHDLMNSLGYSKKKKK